MQAIGGEVGGLADAHAGVTQQQEHIGGEIITPKQFLLKGLILFGGKWAWQAHYAARDVSGSQETSQFGNLFCPSDFLQNAPKHHDSDEISDRRQRRLVRVQVADPAKDVWVAAQLLECMDVGETVTEVEKEVASRAAVN